MSELLRFLRTHKLAWILPIVILLAVALWVAWRISQTPANPFMYESR